jgi:hypothetical protein
MSPTIAISVPMDSRGVILIPTQTLLNKEIFHEKNRNN